MLSGSSSANVNLGAGAAAGKGATAAGAAGAGAAGVGAGPNRNAGPAVSAAANVNAVAGAGAASAGAPEPKLNGTVSGGTRLLPWPSLPPAAGASGVSESERGAGKLGESLQKASAASRMIAFLALHASGACNVSSSNICAPCREKVPGLFLPVSRAQQILP